MEARSEKDGTGSPRGSRETGAKPSAVQKTNGCPKGIKRSAETRDKISAAWTPARKQKFRERMIRAGRVKYGFDPIPSFIDPDFDEGL